MRAHHLCLCSSGVEHFLGKEEAIGSNPITGSIHFTLIMEFERAKCVDNDAFCLSLLGAHTARKADADAKEQP